MLLTFSALILACTALQGAADSLTPTLHEPVVVRDLSGLLDPIRQANEITAMAAVILTSEGVMAEGYVGTLGIDSEVQVRADHVFHLGSCTKAMTATVVATFCEAEQLTWDTTLLSVFPELEKSMDAAWAEVTVAQLMSHTAGAPSHLGAFPKLNEKLEDRGKSLEDLRLEVVRSITAEEPAYTPGSEDLYSNWGYCMLGAMMERISGQSWEELMQERLFDPLAMVSFGFGAPNAEKDAHQPYGHLASGKSGIGVDNPAVIGPAGTVHATLRDWAAFVRLHLRGAREEEGLLLTVESLAALHAPRPGTDDTYGGGWLLARRGWSKGKVLTHSGSNTLWYCTVWIAPEEDFAVLVACNRGGDSGSKATDAACWRLILDQLEARKAEPERQD